MVDIFIIAAYVLTVYVTYPLVVAMRPHWEMRAELTAMGIGLVVLFLLVYLLVANVPTPDLTEHAPDFLHNHTSPA